MSKRSMYALINLIVWVVVMTMFFVLFFNNGGPETWGVDKNKRFYSAILFASGFITFFIVQYKANKEPLDERIKAIQLKATSTTLIIVLMYVFLFGIIVYTKYENTLMPSSWLWLISYSMVFLTYIVNSVLYIFLERSENSYEIK